MELVEIQRLHTDNGLNRVKTSKICKAMKDDLCYAMIGVMYAFD